MHLRTKKVYVVTLRSKHDLTFVSEPELRHSAFHYARLGNFISLFNKIKNAAVFAGGTFFTENFRGK